MYSVSVHKVVTLLIFHFENAIPESAFFCPEGSCPLRPLPPVLSAPTPYFRTLSFMWFQGYQVITH